MIRANATAKRHRRSSFRLVAPTLIALAATLAYGSAWAEQVRNTAQVSYVGDAGAQTVDSNTVVFHVVPQPADAAIEFRRYDTGPDGTGTIPTDGGQCLVGDGYIPLPAVEDPDGAPMDGGGTTGAEGYYVGEPVVVAVTDANRNVDPTVRELVEVALTTTTGDAESV